jgi:potassium efflux system protein
VRYAAFVFGVLALIAFAPVRAQTPAARPPTQAPAVQAPAVLAPPAPAKDKPAPAPANAPSAKTAPAGATAPSSAPAAAPAPAPPPSPDLSRVGETLDKANAALNDIETTLDRHNLTDADLVAARQLIAPIADSVSAAADKVTPRLTEIKARLDQLGAPPDDKSPPENPSVTEERTAQQQSFSNADELLKRAKLLSVRAEQMKTNIAARRRALFTTSLFQRSTSIADAALWSDVWREAPGNINDVVRLFSDWGARINARFDGWSRLAFWLGLPAIFLAYIPFARASLRLFARSEAIERPSRFLKILGAWWVALVIAVPPIALTYLVIYGLDAANLTSLRIQSVFDAVGGDVARMAMTFGLARGLLAPTRPNWRLPPISDVAAARLVGVALSVAGILLITRFCEALNDVIDASLAFSVATRGLGALFAAMALAFGLWRVGADSADAECLGPLVTRRQNWFAILRGLGLAATLVVVAAVLAGYPTFASFFLDQVIWISGVATVFFMASLLVEEAIGSGFRPTARFGNWLVNRIGLQRNSLELLGVVLSGALRLAFFLIAVFAALAPWGLQQADVPFNLRAAFFGFRVGDVVVSPASIIVAIAIFGLIWAAVHALQRWLDGSLLPHTGLDAALRNSITTSLGYVGFILAAGLAFGYLGLSFDKLAIVAGALSVGIGFGLQSIINNFVSGLILLWERAVRVGDWIIVGGDQGFVRRINIRSTEIETVDRAQVIIPNSSLITGVVKNLVRNDRTGRIVIPVTVAGAADPEKVREVLFAAAKGNDRVLKIPAPQIFFTGMSGAALTFELAAFIADVETMARVRSDLHFEIFKQIKANGFFNAPAADPQKIQILGVEGLSVEGSGGARNKKGESEQDQPGVTIAVG